MPSKKNIVLFLLLFLLIVTTRLFKISSVPSVISHDEIYYPVQAKTIALAFTDPSGNWNPLSLTAAHPLYAELPGLIMAPASFFSDPLLAARFTHAVLGSLLVLIVARIGFQVTKQRSIFWGIFLVGLVNPWLFQFSRMGFDALFSLFFYFLGILLYLHQSPKVRLLAIASFILGFYQYQGLKLVFIPLVLAVTLFGYLYRKHHTYSHQHEFAQAATLIAVALLLNLRFIVGIQTQVAQGRTGDLIFSDPTIPAQVQVLRQQSIVSPVQELFNNKATVVIHTFLTNYAASFNPTQLFIYGEPLRNPFSVWSKGMFNPVDALLIFIGLLSLLLQKKYRYFGLFLLFLVVLAPLPSALNAKGIWIMFRSSLYIPTLVLLSGIGLSYLLKKSKIVGFVLCLYLLLSVPFFYDYFYRYPVIGTSGSYFSERIVANYVSRNSDKKIVVLVDETQFVYNSLLHFNRLVTQQNLSEIKQSYEMNQYTLGKLTVDNRCVSKRDIQQGTVVIAAASIPFCEESEIIKFTKPVLTSAIQSLLDSGEQFIIYNDEICTNYALNSSIHVKTDAFAIETLGEKEFCETFFTQTSPGKRITSEIML